MGLEGLLTGHLLCDRYRVERVIGRGGMGAVYCAADVRLDRGVAVKVITAATADVATRVRLRSRFHREARAAARLQHPNVVTVYDFGTDPRLDLDFLVMELLHGEDMARRLARGDPPDVATGLTILEQAARGVAAGHRTGLIHRDIKPGNLFLADEGQEEPRVCVLDFGIVQLTTEEEEATMTHLTVMGRAPHSPAYAAPEQLRGESRLTPASDVWGLGATGFQILTGERPFSDADQRRMMDGMSVPAPSARRRNPDIPTEVDDLLRIALSHRAADRFADAAAFAEAIADAQRGVAPRAQPARPAPRPAPAPAPVAASAEDEEDDRTLLEPAARPERRPSRWRRESRKPTVEPTDSRTLLDPAVLERRPAPVRAEERERSPARERGAGSTPARARGKWLRRTTIALWQLVLTLVAVAVAVAFGAAMFEAFVNNLTEPFYASVAGLTLALPWAIHRIFGRRGSYLLAMLACAVVAVAVFRFLAPVTDPRTAVVALAPAQLAAAIWISRLTRRRPVDDDAMLATPASL